MWTSAHNSTSALFRSLPSSETANSDVHEIMSGAIAVSVRFASNLKRGWAVLLHLVCGEPTMSWDRDRDSAFHRWDNEPAAMVVGALHLACIPTGLAVLIFNPAMV